MSRLPRRRHAGFTLVELMISLAIGLVILLALITMLINVNRNNSEMSISNRMVENGRFAMQLLASDLSHGGYWGGYVPSHDDLTFTAAPTLGSVVGGTVPTAVPDPCLVYSVANWTANHQANLIGITVQGSNVTAAAAVPFCGGVLSAAKGSTDTVVVRHVEPCLAGSGTNECGDTLTAANPDLYFQASRCSSDADGFVMSIVPAAFNLRQRDCTAAAERRRVASSIYYVKMDSGVPTLMRSQFLAAGAVPAHQPAQALVENVEGFRAEFGIDSLSDSGEAVVPTAAVNWADAANKNSPRNRGDGSPDGVFIRCTQASPCTAAQMMNTVAVKLYVLVRAERPTPGHTDIKTYKLGSADANCASAAAADTSATCAPTLGPFNDGYRRQLFTQTVRLVNVSSRRETP